MKKSIAFGVLALSTVLLAPTGIWHDLAFPAAFADDDDGGDDDGNGSGGDAGGNTISGGGNSNDDVRKIRKAKKIKRVQKQRTKAKAKPVRKQTQKIRKKKSKSEAKPVPKPIQSSFALAAPNELVIRKLTTADISRLSENGFQVMTQYTDVNGEITAKFNIPKRTKLWRAREKARALLPGKPVDLNHYFRNGYHVQSSETCKGKSCQPFEMVGWRASLITCQNIPEIGIIDTWVDPAHKALASANISPVLIEDYTTESKGSGHGTAIAALLVGNTAGPAPGLLPQASIATANVFDVSASGDERTDAYLLSSALHAFQKRGTKIVNMSLAGPPNDVLAETIKSYALQGMIIVAASGNAGPTAGPAYPAAYDEVIAVTAVSESLKVYRRAGRGKHIDISAPGVQIKTAGKKSDVEIFTGSSFAVPFVTAAVAAQMAGAQTISTTSLVDVLKRDAKDLGEPGMDPIFGAGLLQFSNTCAK